MSLVATLVHSHHLRPADARLAAWIARAFPSAPSEATLAAALAARAVAEGHSALPLDKAQAWLDGLDATAAAPHLPDLPTWRRALAQLPDGLPLVLDAAGRVYLRRYAEYERALAATLVQRASNPYPNVVAAPASALAGTDPEQRHAIEVALKQRLTVITGGPGTGKTYIVMRMLAALAHAAAARGTTLRIALAAPTGKAAARLNETLRAQLATLQLPTEVIAQLEAGTLHRLLGLSPWRATPRHGRAAPLPFDVVVVDEVSMVDLPLMAKLAAAVADEARLILLGDPQQLAAVEAGDVLGALVAAAARGDLGRCHAALARSHRFGAESALARLAGAVAAGDADAALASLGTDASVALADAATPHALVAAASAAYARVVQAESPAAALDAARSYRVLTALRHGAWGCVALDRAIAAHLVRRLGRPPATHWWQGRLVMVTSNRDELGLYNGDTGVVFADKDGVMKAWFEGPDGQARGFAPAVLPPIEGAFALTVHKAQGSEFECVALATGPASQVLTRELLYTGITRARAALTVYSDAAILRTAIARRGERFGGLADRLHEAAAALPP